tara:strand:+ start:276 stop:428 length:153 start_codon:yes stop_codon:yes gene_type:complete
LTRCGIDPYSNAVSESASLDAPHAYDNVRERSGWDKLSLLFQAGASGDGF